MLAFFLLFSGCLVQAIVSQQCLNLAEGLSPGNGDIVLGTSPSNSSGVVHVYLNGTWGTVCYSESFNAADRICRQLGYSRSTSVTGVPWEPSCPVLLSDVDCSGDDFHLLRCNFEEGTTCDTIASVTCDTSNVEESYYMGQLRLFNGSLSSNGLLQVFLNNEWGAVCSQYFNDTIADITCRQLKYTSALNHGNYKYPSDDRTPRWPIWVKNMVCPSNSSCFTDCYTAPAISLIDCNYERTVYLACTFETDENDGELTASDCEIVIYSVPNAIRIILLIIFSAIVLAYITIFVVRFLVAAWHKSERYKKTAAARRYDFKNTYTKTLSRNSMTPEGFAVFNT